MKWWIGPALILAMVGCSSSKKEDPVKKNEPQAQTGSQGSESEENAVLSDVEQKPVANYDKLEEAVQKKDPSSILRESSKLLAIDKNDLRALNALSRSYYHQNKLGMSETLLVRALKISPGHATFYNQLGLIFLRRDQLGKAIVAFKKGESSDSSNRQIASNLGSIYAQYGDYPKAAPRFAKLDISKLEDDRLLNNVAITYWRTNKLDLAEEAFGALIEKKLRPEYLYNFAAFLVDGKKDLSSADQKLKELEKMRTSRALQAKVKILKKKVSRRLAKAGDKK